MACYYQFCALLELLGNQNKETINLLWITAVGKINQETYSEKDISPDGNRWEVRLRIVFLG